MSSFREASNGAYYKAALEERGGWPFGFDSEGKQLMESDVSCQGPSCDGGGPSCRKNLREEEGEALRVTEGCSPTQRNQSVKDVP